jgi:signal transduction histidine kinase/DNA-binding response OmpR family regulator
LASLLQEILDQTIYPEHIMMLLRTENNETWDLLANNTNESSLTLPQNHFLERLAQHPMAIGIAQLRDDPKFRDVHTEGTAFMKTLQAEFVVPLLQGDQIIAVIALGERRNLKAYTQTDLDFLDRLAAEASKGFINANLYTKVDKQRRDLQDLATTLEERVKSRTLELEHANESLRLLDHHKTNFFANISHEFRTPLTLILGQIESSIPTVIQEETQSKLLMAFRNAQQLLRLINQLLDLSKIEAGSMVLKTRRVNLIPFLKYSVFSFESLAEHKRILLEFSTTHEEIEIHFEPEKLEKVFYNLLSNAFKFTPEGGKVSVSVRRGQKVESLASTAERFEHNAEKTLSSMFSTLDSAPSSIRPLQTNDCVEISIRDTGIGIPAEELPRIFDRFYQVDGTHTREHEGTGIGLALAMELIKLHHGEITVTSEVGLGSEFVVKLPFGTQHLKANEIFEDIGPFVAESDYLTRPSDEFFVTPITPSPLAPATPTVTDLILVVEDNADMRSYIREHLEKHYKIIEATNGEEGLAKAQETIPDLIITDVMMPKIDGFEFSRKLRSDEKTSHIPIIVLTAKAALENKIEGLETGVDDYLTKPFSPKEMLARVHNLIKLRRQLRERFSREVVLKPQEIAITPMDEVFLNKVKAVVEKRLGDEDFEVEALSREVGMSRSQIHRKLKALTDQSASQFIRSLRLQRAVELLKQNAGTVAEIAYQVGFGSQAYFTKCFHEQFGCSPKEYVKNSF